MIQTLRRTPISISLQLVAGLVFLILLAALAIGVPAILSMRAQLDELAWSLADQALHTTQAQISTQLSDLQNLAVLTAQRPTLIRLAQGGETAELHAYLETLRKGATLDALVVCRGVETLDNVGTTLPGACRGITNLVPGDARPFLDRIEDQGGSAIWLLASQVLADGSTTSVTVGQRLDDAALTALSEQIGVAFVLLQGETPLASSLQYPAGAWHAITGTPAPLELAVSAGTMTLAGAPYYALRMAFVKDIDLLLALPVAGIQREQLRLTRNILVAMALAVVLSAGLGVLLAQRISRPLDRLRISAVALRQGELERPIITHTRVREIAQVSYALEDARIALQHSLAQLQQEQAWSSHLLAAVVEGILTLDKQGRITFFSQGAERITGYTKDDALFKHLDDVLISADENLRFSQRLPLSGGSQETIQVRLRDQVRTLAVTAARLAPAEAGSAQLVLVLRDVSNEEAIRRLLGDFLANITHEFRTPLTAQAAAVELLLDQLETLNHDELRELLKAQYLGVLNLQTLIDNLLEGASIEAGRFRVAPAPLELEEVTSGVAHTLAPLLEKYHLSLCIEMEDELPLVQADARRTAQALTNLISNAIKWSPSDGVITLRAALQDGMARLSVSDQGPGIAVEQKAGLFTWLPNLQTKSGRADYGAGLGLSVVRAIVEAQGGQVGVEDAPGGGAVFWFTLPLAEQSLPEIAL